MLVRFDNVTFSYTGEPVLSDVSFTLNEKERVGLLGGNGEGKTTLLRLLTGGLTPSQGTISKGKFRLGYLEQNCDFSPSGTVREAMREVFEEDERLLSELSRVQNEMTAADADSMKRLSARAESLNKRIAARDSYSYEVKIQTVLNGMGFGEMKERTVSSMSGGEKTKLKLCRLLLEEPELLVLDEPTNHLDVKTLFWLEEYLSSFKGAILAVSHDRYFLDRLTARTLEIERGKLYSYKGNYTKYRVLKAERVLTETRAYERQREEIAKLQDYVNRNLVRATTAKSALSRVNRLERMELLEKPLPSPEPPRFSFSYDVPPHERVLRAENFSLAAGGKTLLASASFTLMRGERCAVVGDNGTGKTTLLRFLLSRDPRVSVGRYVHFAYYDQENSSLDPEETALGTFRSQNVLWSQTEARKLLAQAGLGAGDVGKKVKELSGGLKAKLSLALLEAKRANVLVLDEPTNHLDLPARESLEEALQNYGGTLLFVSHDRRFLQALATKIFSIENGTLECFSGSYDEFLAEKKKREIPVTAEPVKRTDAYRSKEDRAREAKTRARMKEIETRLQEIENEDAELEEELMRRAADYVAVREISERREALRAETDALYDEYGTLI